MTEEIKHIQVNGKYRITIEKAAGVKTGDGFKVEANSDDIQQVEIDAGLLYLQAKAIVAASIPPVEEKK